jgi:hypothetical protein
VTNKARFIAQILDNESPARVSVDMDETVLTFAEIQAIAAGNPDIKRRIETSNELAELNMLKREWGYERAKMREHLEVLPAQLEKAQTTLANAKIDSESAKKVAAMDELPLDNKRIHAQVRQAISNLKDGKSEPIQVGTVGGFSISVVATEEVKGLSLENYSSEIVARFVVKGEGEYSCDAGVGEFDNNVVRLKNLFAKVIPTRAETAESEVTRISENIEQAKSQVDKEFEHGDRIVELEKLLEELDDKLSGVTKQEDVTADPEDMELVETNEEKAEREAVYNADDSDYQPTNDDDDPDLSQGRKGR